MKSAEEGKLAGKSKQVSISFGGLGGVLMLALLLLIAWWLIGGILSITVGQLLLYAGLLAIGYAIGRGRL